VRVWMMVWMQLACSEGHVCLCDETRNTRRKNSVALHTALEHESLSRALNRPYSTPSSPVATGSCICMCVRDTVVCVHLCVRACVCACVCV